MYFINMTFWKRQNCGNRTKDYQRLKNEKSKLTVEEHESLFVLMKILYILIVVGATHVTKLT